MGIMTTLVTSGRSSISDSEINGQTAWLEDTGEGSGRMSMAGVKVDESSAMALSAVFGCVRAIAEDCAKLPLKLYQENGGGKDTRRDDPLYDLVKNNPNPEMGSFDFRCALMANAIMWHGGFAEIERSKTGDALALWPIYPSQVKIKRDKNRQLYYEVTNSPDDIRQINPQDMIHIKGFGDNGLAGFMMSHVARDSMGVYKAAENFTSSFFKNGATLMGVVEAGAPMEQAQMNSYVSRLEKTYAGIGKYFKLMVLNKGSVYKPISSDPEKSQLLQTIQFRVEDIARWFRVPPHIIGHLARSTFSNIEHQGLEYLTNCLDPWLTKTEQEANRKLLQGRKGAFFEHTRDKILMSDTKSRYESYNLGILGGYLNANEVRSKENMNPIPGGDRYLVPQNMAIVDENGNVSPVNKPSGSTQVEAGEATADDKKKSAQDIDRAKLAAMPVLVDAAQRMIARETNAIMGKKDKGADQAWASVFYDNHAKACASAYEPGIASLLFAMGQKPDIAQACAQKVARAHVTESQISLMASEDIEATLNHWQTHRPAAMAQAILKEVFHDQTEHTEAD